MRWSHPPDQHWLLIVMCLSANHISLTDMRRSWCRDWLTDRARTAALLWLVVGITQSFAAAHKKLSSWSAQWVEFAMLVSSFFSSYLWILVLCEYSKLRIESNSYFSIRFDLKRAQLFEMHKGAQENDVSVKMCMCTVLLLTMVQVLYLLEVFILAHYGPPSTETPTTETTTVCCYKNSWIYLTSTYYWWLLRPTITIRFDSKFQIIAQQFYSIRNEKALFAQH